MKELVDDAARQISHLTHSNIDQITDILQKTELFTLLKQAVEFDAGKPVYINGILIEDQYLPLRHHLKISFRGENSWVICMGSMVINKLTDEFQFEPSPSNRTEVDIYETRFSSPMEAMEFLKEWRIRERERLD